MRLICPACGAMCSADAMNNDADCRATIAALVRLPDPLPASALAYLALFRSDARALSWKKASKLVAELAALVAAGHVQVDKRAARPCPPYLWARAIENMQASTTITRPLPNHNYLRQVAYGLADQADAAGEKERNQQERAGNFTRPVGINPLYEKMMSGVENG